MAYDTHLSVRSLLDGTAQVEGEHVPVAGLWLDGDRPRFLGLDIRGWIDSHVALVPFDRARWDGGWAVEVTREEVEAPSARLTEKGGPLDLTSLPPVLTGPFGNTVSPLMIGAGLLAETKEETPPAPPQGGVDAELPPREEARALPRARDLLGLPIAARHDVIGRGSSAGPTVDDLLIDPETMRLSHAVIGAGGEMHAVPMEHLGEAKDGVVPLALTRAELEAMPRIATPNEVRVEEGLTPRPG